MSDRGLIIAGDEIYYEGILVGLVADTPYATIKADFIHKINNATIFEDEPDLCSECEKELTNNRPSEDDEDEAYDAALDDLLSGIKPFVKGGLVRYDDLSRIAKQLKEELE